MHELVIFSPWIALFLKYGTDQTSSEKFSGQ